MVVYTTCSLSPLLSSGHYKIVNLLIEAGANISFVNAEGQTALHLAVANGNLNSCQTLYKCNRINEKVIEALLKNGADPYLEDQNGKSSIDVANEKGMFLR